MGFERKLFTCVLLATFTTSQLFFFGACFRGGGHVGVNYGTNGDNLPAPLDVLHTFQENGIFYIRIYDPNLDILNVFRGFPFVFVCVGMKNADISGVAQSLDVATSWVKTNIVPFEDIIEMVTIGNEVIPGPDAPYIAQAMTNIISALNSVGLSRIKVSTTTAFNLQTSFPPSAGAFTPEISQIMKDVTHVLRENASPLLVSFYPYFAYASNPREISFEYATFTAQTPVIDGELQYFSLLEAQIDAYYAALAAIGAGDISIVIAESGWPTAGNEPYTSVTNAQTYNQNLIKRINSKKGTPRKPDVPLDTYIFAMFDENQKEAGIEQHFGIFSPNREPKYPLKFWEGVQ